MCSVTASQNFQDHQEEIDDIQIQLNARDHIVIAAHLCHNLLSIIDYVGTEEYGAKECECIASVDAHETANTRIDEKSAEARGQEHPSYWAQIVATDNDSSKVKPANITRLRGYEFL